MMHIKDLEKENKKSQGHVIPALASAVCLPLHSTWVSQPPAPQTTYLPGRSLERILILEGHL